MFILYAMAPFTLYNVVDTHNKYIRVYWSPKQQVLWSPEITAPDNIDSILFTSKSTQAGEVWWFPPNDKQFLGAFADKFRPQNSYNSASNDIVSANNQLLQEALLDTNGIPVPYTIQLEQQHAIEQRQSTLKEKQDTILELLSGIRKNIAENTKVIQTFNDATKSTP